MKKKLIVSIFCILLGFSFCQPIRAVEASKRYWIDELAGPIGNLKGKGVELRQKVRELKVVQEEGLGGRDGRMTRWIRVYETQFPWMLLASTEERWERKSKRAAIRSYGECIRSPFLLAPMLQREFGKCAIPFEMPFGCTQLGSITSFLSRINEIPPCSKTDSARCRYREGMPYPFTLVSAPNDYNKLDVICDLRTWFSEGRGKDRHPDFQAEFHDAVKAERIEAKDFPIGRIKASIIDGLADWLNIELQHEQLFMGDGTTYGWDKNMNFMPDEKFAEGYVRTDPKTYDDCIMAEAVKRVKPTHYQLTWFGPDTKYNCQDYAAELRRVYYILENDKEVKCKCKRGQ